MKSPYPFSAVNPNVVIQSLMATFVGLGVPFVLLALGFTKATRSLAWLRRNGRRIEIAGGLLLVAIGLLFVTGRWQGFFVPLQRWFARLGWPPV